MTPQITPHSQGSAGNPFPVHPAHLTPAAASPTLPLVLTPSSTPPILSPLHVLTPPPPLYPPHPSALLLNRSTAPNPSLTKLHTLSPNLPSPLLTPSYPSPPPTPHPSQPTQNKTQHQWHRKQNITIQTSPVKTQHTHFSYPGN